MHLLKVILCLLLTYMICEDAVDASFSIRALSRVSNAGLESALAGQLKKLGSRVRKQTVGRFASAVCRPNESKCQRSIFRRLIPNYLRLCISHQCKSSVILKPSSSSLVVKGVTDRSHVAKAAESRGLPKEVTQKLQAVAFSRSVQFQTFTFMIDTRIGSGIFETFVGAARCVSDTDVEFGVVKGMASAQLVMKTTPVPKRSCRRIFFVKKCRTRTVHVPRGNTAQELKRIEQTLRNYAVEAMRLRLREIGVNRRSRRQAEPEDVEPEDVEPEDVEPDNLKKVEDSADATVCSGSLVTCTRAFLAVQQQRVDEANDADVADSSNATTLVRLVRRGFDRLRKSSTTQRLQGIRVSMATQFVSAISRSLQLPKSLARPLEDAVVRELDAAGENSSWRVFSAIFSTKEAEESALNCLVVFVRRSSDTFDFAYANTGVSLKLADDLLLLKRPDNSSDEADKSGDGDESEDETLVIRRVPRRFTEHDVRQTAATLQLAAAQLLTGRLA